MRDWSRARGDDTLILVLADHTHPVSIIGTLGDDGAGDPNATIQERVRLYARAGFPNYPAPDAEGYPARVDVSSRLAMFSPGFDANGRNSNPPGPPLASLPLLAGASVHSGEDVILTSSGPGSEAVRGQMDNTDVFRVMAEALGLGAGSPATMSGTAK